jgi:hypothetical protein
MSSHFTQGNPLHALPHPANHILSPCPTCTDLPSNSSHPASPINPSTARAFSIQRVIGFGASDGVIVCQIPDELCQILV